MFNLIRSEVYKFFKGKMFYITFGAFIFISVFHSIEYLIIQGRINNPSTALVQVEYLKSFVSSGAFWGKNAPYVLLSNIAYWYIAISVLVSGIVVSEFSTGTIKNIISSGKRRIDIYFSKLLTLSLGSLILLVTVTIATCTSATIVDGWGGAFTFDSLVPIIRTAGLEAVMFLAIASFMMMIAILVRNPIATIALGFIFPIGLMVLERLCNLVDSMKFLLDYFPSRLMSAVAVPNPEGYNIGLTLWVGIGFIIVSTAIGLFTFLKRDINIQNG